MDKAIKNVLIFGDSYSTFEGYIPEGYATYYAPVNIKPTDVCRVEETWWKSFIDKIGGNLVLNNSWSGSTIGYTGYGNSDCSQSSSFIYRFRKLLKEGFFKDNAVDTVIVFGGTNDSWSDAPLGGMKFSDWQEGDLFSVLPAICYLAYGLKQELPNANVIFLVNTEIKEEIRTALREAAEHYGAQAVMLQDIDKAGGHPTVNGMASICEQLLRSVILENNQ
ncbi:MAG: hypothetical protein IJX87_01390 [Clostridia bacterium]|nr:hypothetical protein [Clostridia bacterium]